MYVLRLELIGHTNRAYLQLASSVCREISAPDFIGKIPSCGWVARIKGADPKHGMAREFCKPMVDYEDANGTGNRGVHAVYFLKPGLYEAYQRLSWRSSDRYFFRIDGNTLTRVSKEEVSEWVSSKDLASTSSRLRAPG